jgi:hypothetical protein
MYVVQGLREIVLFHDMKQQQGLSVSWIVRKVGCDAKAARKFLEYGFERPIYGPR